MNVTYLSSIINIPYGPYGLKKFSLRVAGFELSADKSKLVIASADIPSEERFSF